MVYSSSAIKSFLQRDDTFAIVGPQILWASLGIVAMLVMMRVDYRWLRVASIPMFIVGVAGLVLVFIPAINIEVGGSARWLKIGPLPAVHPAEFMKLALVVYLAHWFAKRGGSIRGLRSGTVPFLVIVVPVVVLVLLEPDLGTSSVLAFTAFTMFFLAGANVLHLVGLGARRRPDGRADVPARLPDGPDHGLARPVGRPGRHRLPQHPGLSRARAGRAPRAPGSARAGSPAGCSSPTRSTTTSSRSSARSSGCSAAGS